MKKRKIDLMVITDAPYYTRISIKWKYNIHNQHFLLARLNLNCGTNMTAKNILSRSAVKNIGSHPIILDIWKINA